MAAWNMKLARERRHPLPRHHPLYRRKLELSAEHTAFALGHRSLLENCPLFLCLMLGVHSSPRWIPIVRHERRLAALTMRSDIGGPPNKKGRPRAAVQAALQSDVGARRPCHARPGICGPGAIPTVDFLLHHLGVV